MIKKPFDNTVLYLQLVLSFVSVTFWQVKLTAIWKNSLYMTSLSKYIAAIIATWWAWTYPIIMKDEFMIKKKFEHEGSVTSVKLKKMSFLQSYCTNILTAAILVAELEIKKIGMWPVDTDGAPTWISNKVVKVMLPKFVLYLRFVVIIILYTIYTHLLRQA